MALASVPAPPPAVFVPITQPEQELEAKLNIPVALVKHN